MAQKRPGVPYAKGRKFCIFCGAPADSEEHIMPQWAHPSLPKVPMHRAYGISGRRSTGVMKTNKDYVRQGSVYTVRVPYVCGSCNSGWMGDFEEAVRPAFERMIRGESTFLPLEMRQALAKYLTYKMLLLDWIDRDPALPAEWGHEFYKNRTIPEGTKIWLFRCIEGKWLTDIHTYGCGLTLDDDPDALSELPINTKSFAVGFGELLVFAVLSSQVDLNIDFDPMVSAKLWPFEPKLMRWPPRAPLGSDQAEFISTSLWRVGESPNINLK